MRSCAFPECPKPLLAKGYCDTHYTRLRKYGDVHAVQRTSYKRASETGAVALPHSKANHVNNCLRCSSGCGRREVYCRTCCDAFVNPLIARWAKTDREFPASAVGEMLGLTEGAVLKRAKRFI